MLETIAGTNGRRHAVVTGAASGIGERIARRLARDGMEVVGVDRDEAGLGRLVPDGVTPLVVDLASPAERRRPRQLHLPRMPLARSSTPDELAGLIAFLRSDEANMTGQALNFSGGLVMT